MESSIKYEPKFGRVLIRRELKVKTAGGIYLPETQVKRHANCEGVVLALGETAGWSVAYDSDGNQVTKQIFKVGDTVLFGRHAGTWLDATAGVKGDENDDGTLFICQDEDILAVIKPQACEKAA